MVIKMESNNLEEAALKRKEKLNALKRKREGVVENKTNDNEDTKTLPKYLKQFQYLFINLFH